MNPQIRFIRKYGTFRVGEVIAPPAGLRSLLLREKYAEMVETSPALTKKPAGGKRKTK